MTKTIVLQRIKDGRSHRTILRADVPLHIDIVSLLHSRLLRYNINADIDELMDSVIDKR